MALGQHAGREPEWRDEFHGRLEHFEKNDVQRTRVHFQAPRKLDHCATPRWHFVAWAAACTAAHGPYGIQRALSRQAAVQRQGAPYRRKHFLWYERMQRIDIRITIARLHVRGYANAARNNEIAEPMPMVAQVLPGRQGCSTRLHILRRCATNLVCSIHELVEQYRRIDVNYKRTKYDAGQPASAKAQLKPNVLCSSLPILEQASHCPRRLRRYLVTIAKGFRGSADVQLDQAERVFAAFEITPSLILRRFRRYVD